MTALPLPLAMLERRLGYDEGSLDGPDKARAEDALTDATTVVLAEVAEKVATRWRTNLPEVVRLVVLKAARREFENPEGYRSQGLGEFSASVDTASGVYLTAHEEAVVRRAASGRRGGFTGSVRTPSAYAGIDPDAVLIAPVVMAGEPLDAVPRDGIRLVDRDDL